ncbi:hypothetical protein [Acinetobacter pittii]|uniref:hypothetical protein n=1 Tax=Acinetobacter pittii TaxID=48296 RepID=UPI00148E99DA|nr:hypothetical protein [Acinetobacter pittii]
MTHKGTIRHATHIGACAIEPPFIIRRYRSDLNVIEWNQAKHSRVIVLPWAIEIKSTIGLSLEMAKPKDKCQYAWRTP